MYPILKALLKFCHQVFSNYVVYALLSFYFDKIRKSYINSLRLKKKFILYTTRVNSITYCVYSSRPHRH